MPKPTPCGKCTQCPCGVSGSLTDAPQRAHSQSPPSLSPSPTLSEDSSYLEAPQRRQTQFQSQQYEHQIYQQQPSYESFDRRTVRSLAPPLAQAPGRVTIQPTTGRVSEGTSELGQRQGQRLTEDYSMDRVSRNTAARASGFRQDVSFIQEQERQSYPPHGQSRQYTSRQLSPHYVPRQSSPHRPSRRGTYDEPQQLVRESYQSQQQVRGSSLPPQQVRGTYNEPQQLVRESYQSQQQVRGSLLPPQQVRGSSLPPQQVRGSYDQPPQPVHGGYDRPSTNSTNSTQYPKNQANPQRQANVASCVLPTKVEKLKKASMNCNCGKNRTRKRISGPRDSYRASVATDDPDIPIADTYTCTRPRRDPRESLPVESKPLPPELRCNCREKKKVECYCNPPVKPAPSKAAPREKTHAYVTCGQPSTAPTYQGAPTARGKCGHCQQKKGCSIQ